MLLFLDVKKMNANHWRQLQNWFGHFKAGFWIWLNSHFRMTAITPLVRKQKCIRNLSGWQG
jgi:hypothetical protein